MARSRAPAKPWSKTKARQRVITPDQRWALGIVRRMLLDCHPWQRDTAIDPAKRIAMLVGRGGAKTTTKRVRALVKLLLLPNQYIGYAATSADQARELNWNKLKDVCEAYEIKTTGADPDVSFLDTKMIMRCHRTGSIYRLRGVEDRRDAEKFRGFPQTEFQVDECGSFPPDLLEYLVDSCVGPRLGEALTLPPWLLEALCDEERDLDSLEFEPDRGGAIVLGSTPPARLVGPFYEATRDGSDQHRPYKERHRPEFANWLGYSSHAWTLKDVVDLADSSRHYPALVANWQTALREKERKQWGDDHPIWLREYLGRWSADNTTTVFRYRPHKDGEAWNQWNPLAGRPLEGIEALKAAIEALPKDVGTWHYVLAMDSGGSRDPFAASVYAFAPLDTRRRMFHVFGLERMRMHARPIAELLLGPEPESHPGTARGGLFGVIGWPDAIEFDAEPSLLDELRNVYGVPCKKAEKKADYKYGAIELVNGDLIEGRILVISGSVLERQLQTLQWKPDEYGILREDKAQANHSTDTLVYGRRALANLFEAGVVSDGKPDSTAPTASPEVGFLRDRPENSFDDMLVSDDFDGGYSL